MAQNLHLYHLRQRCREENAKFRKGEKHDDSFCFELFYEALHERNELAWQIIYEGYRPQVIIWIRRHPSFASLSREIEDYVQDAFIRLHKSFKPDHFRADTTLYSILKYLRMCVHHAIVSPRSGPILLPLPDPADEEGSGNEIPDSGLDPSDVIMGEERQTQLKALFKELISDEQERFVIEATFKSDLPPRKIFELYPDKFQSVSEVSRIKARVFKRLKDNPMLQRLFTNQ